MPGRQWTVAISPPRTHFGGGVFRQCRRCDRASAPRGSWKATGEVANEPKPHSAAGALVKDATTASFAVDVIAESARQPVLSDFWAPWCETCKQLAAVLEKIVKAAAGKVKLVRMNIDAHPEIPGQLGVRSIPAVIAFQHGQPIVGFIEALPEHHVQS